MTVEEKAAAFDSVKKPLHPNHPLDERMTRRLTKGLSVRV
jgi:hypothetical protein